MKSVELNKIVSDFIEKSENYTIEPFGGGLINDTYLVKSSDESHPNYILQRINHNIFTDVDMLMNNIDAATNHLRKKLLAKSDGSKQTTLKFIPTVCDGKLYSLVDGNYWRMMEFIPNAVTKQEVNEESSYAAGVSFGEFQSMLTDIPVELGEVIPNFHNMEFRLSQLRDAVSSNLVGRLDEVKYFVEEIERRAEDMCKAERLFREGKLPKRICHCDTKVNNMIFDKSDNVMAIIDLDTLMPSFIFSDYGDFLRTGANTGAEDDKNLDNVNFNIPIFEAFTKGYLKGASSFLTPIEIENLPYAAALFPYMQCVRFLADYINGDTYYKINYPDHNLVRTKAQFKLLQSVEQNTPHMKSFIDSCLIG
ncbi:MAG: phosphotransferase enzyme family protein [Bacteroidales bacterium]